ncbi:prolyl oligopeptidase family serine peptidase [Sphingobacterium sp. LRF_L2]|uniref:S9 family peptidase n=1 Tax=Sphingobacterium sp. LRF_L2 TaxID=3369421 RepID=UPI003F5D7B0D
MIRNVLITGTIIIVQSLVGLNLFAQKIPVQVTDLLKISRAADVQLSADENYVIFSISNIVSDSSARSNARPSGNFGRREGGNGAAIGDSQGGGLEYAYKRELWIIDLKNNNTLSKLDEKAEGVNQPVFSPSGKQFAFTRNVKGVSQIFLYTLSTGRTKQITDLKYGASGLKWSPDGKRLAFISNFTLQQYVKDYDDIFAGLLVDWRKENQDVVQTVLRPKVKPDPNGSDEAIRAYLQQNEKDQKAKVIARNSSNPEESPREIDQRLSHIFIIDTISGSQPKELTNGLLSFSNLIFAGDTRLFVNVRGAGEGNDNPAAEELSFGSVYSVNTDGSGFHSFLSSSKESYSVTAASSTGNWFAFQRSVPGTVNVTRTYVKDLKVKDGKVYPISIDRSLSNLKFIPGDKEIYFVAQENGGNTLYRGSWTKDKYERLTVEDEGVSDFDIQHNTVVYAKTTAQNPSELFLNIADGKKESRLTQLNTEWLKERTLSLPEKHKFTNELGLELEYWVVKPVGFDKSTKYPLLLEMHGGPASMWGPGEQSMWHEFQYFAGKGIGIVYGNPRGSGGYGEEFLRANKSDWAKGPSRDVLTFLDRTVAQGWVDTTKLLISGGSYAGYLTTWILAHDKRFLAASSQRGVYDFKTFLGEGRVWHIIPRYYDGYPWTPKVGKLLQEESPINYVEAINTPLLIFIGENDTQVGVSQSDMLYRSLKLLGKPVEYVRHPGAGHEVTRSGDNRQRIDQMLRTYEFFERYLSADKNIR